MPALKKTSQIFPCTIQKAQGSSRGKEAFGNASSCDVPVTVWTRMYKFCVCSRSCVCVTLCAQNNVLGSVLLLFPKLVFSLNSPALRECTWVQSLCYFSLCLWGLRIFHIITPYDTEMSPYPYSTVSRCVLLGVTFAWVTISHFLICVAPKLGHSTLSMRK